MQDHETFIDRELGDGPGQWGRGAEVGPILHDRRRRSGAPDASCENEIGCTRVIHIGYANERHDAGVQLRIGEAIQVQLDVRAAIDVEPALQVREAIELRVEVQKLHLVPVRCEIQYAVPGRATFLAEHGEYVVASTADQNVCSRTAAKLIGALPPVQAVVARAAEQNVNSAPLQRTSEPLSPWSKSLPDPDQTMSLPSPPNDVDAGLMGRKRGRGEIDKVVAAAYLEDLDAGLHPYPEPVATREVVAEDGGGARCTLDGIGEDRVVDDLRGGVRTGYIHTRYTVIVSVLGSCFL